MYVKFKSTRGDSKLITASQAIIKGIANDGGLYIPEKINKIDFELNKILDFNYQELAYEILKLILTDFTEKELKYCIKNAYDNKFDTSLIAPLKSFEKNNFLELFHGKTLAFKDMALSILPYLLKVSAEKNGINKDIVILTATSGDTGKAALEGFADVEGIKIIVFFPQKGVSDIQKAQMVTQNGKNTCVVGIKGNFDDAQTGVKDIFNDKEFNQKINKKGYIFSSANSINIGRLAPQIVYYFYAYAQIVKAEKIKMGDKINFTVPTGNFGNILAGFYAKQMGLPVNKLICATNDNKVLYDFFNTGIYDINRKFIVTVSPSMDILISSNLERLLYHLSQNTEKTNELMSNLNNLGRYKFDIMTDEFESEFVSQKETFDSINEVYKNNNYIMDTHTSVAYTAYHKYMLRTKDNTENIIVSTASPYKFAKDVCIAIDNKYKNLESFEALNLLSKLESSKIPDAVADINKREIFHNNLIDKSELKKFVINYLI